MVRTLSTMLELGTRAPDFCLPDHGEAGANPEVCRDDALGGKGLLVAFICNHCPYVILMAEAFAAFADDYRPRGLGVVAINSNDVENYPDDHPSKMTAFARAKGFSFPYLFDESQDVAKAYGAACTPDLYLFDAELSLVYRGQFDAARPGNGVEPNGADLRAAADRLLAGEPVDAAQTPSMGCNIKWRSGNEPQYFAAQ